MLNKKYNELFSYNQAVTKLVNLKSQLFIFWNNIALFVVDGNWSPWAEWSECSRTCGFGQKMRIRLCNNPRPSNTGRWCPGDATQTDRCRDRFCQGA